MIDLIYATPREVAECLKVSEETLATWRRENKGPPWYQLNGPGGSVRYLPGEVHAWVANRTPAPK
jgi:predicted DNA-binding transcriptional regulator AlpA